MKYLLWAGDSEKDAPVMLRDSGDHIQIDNCDDDGEEEDGHDSDKDVA